MSVMSASDNLSVESKMSALHAKAAEATAKAEASIKAKAAIKAAKEAVAQQKKADATAAKEARAAAKAAADALPKRPRGRPRKDGLPPGSKSSGAGAGAGAGDAPIYSYLFELQKSGAVNMFGASPLLEERFGMTPDVANRYLTGFMDNYAALKAKYSAAPSPSPSPAPSPSPSLLPPGEEGEIAALRNEIKELRAHMAALQTQARQLDAIRMILQTPAA
jgi:hypothetical protein